mgnify:CR=1 FL=1
MYRDLDIQLHQLPITMVEVAADLKQNLPLHKQVEQAAVEHPLTLLQTINLILQPRVVKMDLNTLVLALAAV